MIDLHVHSRFSDGTDSPDELVGRARRLGLRALALTDHDNTRGVKAFLAACRTRRLSGIAGIEVYTPDHTGAQRERYRGFARDLGLIQTGGSDYHGWKDNSGNTLGAAATPPGEFRRLAELAGAARVWP